MTSRLSPILKTALLFGPILLLFVLDALVLPINTFTFRQWEALMTRFGQNRDYAFLPKADLVQREYGDTFRYQTIVAPRVTRWVTDDIGYRNRSVYAADQAYCFVTIGDSNVVGSSLDQTETLSSMLERDAGCRAYNAAASGWTPRYFYRREFRANPPKFLLLQAIAGHFYSDAAFSTFLHSGQMVGYVPNPSWTSQIAAASIGKIDPSNPRSQAWILDEVISRNALLNFVRARTGMADAPQPPRSARHNEFRNIAEGSATTASQAVPTLQGVQRHAMPSAADYLANCPESLRATEDAIARAAVCRFVVIIRSLATATRADGSELILYMQPALDTYLAPGIALLKSEGIRIVHFPPTRDLLLGIDFDWYWAGDDTHWHPRAVELAARLIIAASRGEDTEAMLPEIHRSIASEMRSIRAR